MKIVRIVRACDSCGVGLRLKRKVCQFCRRRHRGNRNARAEKGNDNNAGDNESFDEKDRKESNGQKTTERKAKSSPS